MIYSFFFWTHLDGSKYCFLSKTIQLNICHLGAQLKDQTVLFQTTDLSIYHLFALSLNVKQFYLIGPYEVLPFRVRVDLGVMAMKVYSTFAQIAELESHLQIF